MQENCIHLRGAAHGIVTNLMIHPQSIESKKQDTLRSRYSDARQYLETTRDSLKNMGLRETDLSCAIANMNITINDIVVPNESRILRHGILKPRARIAGTGALALRIKEFILDMIALSFVVAPDQVKVPVLKEREVPPEELEIMESMKTIRELYHATSDVDIHELARSIVTILRSEGGAYALADALRNEIMDAMRITQDPLKCFLTLENCTEFFKSADDEGNRVGAIRSRWRKNLHDSLRTHLENLPSYLV